MVTVTVPIGVAKPHPDAVTVCPLVAGFGVNVKLPVSDGPPTLAAGFAAAGTAVGKSTQSSANKTTNAGLARGTNRSRITHLSSRLIIHEDLGRTWTCPAVSCGRLAGYLPLFSNYGVRQS